MKPLASWPSSPLASSASEACSSCIAWYVKWAGELIQIKGMTRKLKKQSQFDIFICLAWKFCCWYIFSERSLTDRGYFQSIYMFVVCHLMSSLVHQQPCFWRHIYIKLFTGDCQDISVVFKITSDSGDHSYLFWIVLWNYGTKVMTMLLWKVVTSMTAVNQIIYFHVNVCNNTFLWVFCGGI